MTTTIFFPLYGCAYVSVQGEGEVLSVQGYFTPYFICIPVMSGKLACFKSSWNNLVTLVFLVIDQDIIRSG